MRREEAVDFVEDDEGAQALGAGECADPGEQFFEQDAEDEGALFVVEMGGADDDARGAPLTRSAGVLGGEPLVEVERGAPRAAGGLGRLDPRVVRPGFQR